MTNEEQEWAIRGWLATLVWVDDRDGARTVDEAIEYLVERHPEFADAPTWLMEGVRAGTNTPPRPYLGIEFISGP